MIEYSPLSACIKESEVSRWRGVIYPRGSVTGNRCGIDPRVDQAAAPCTLPLPNVSPAHPISMSPTVTYWSGFRSPRRPIKHHGLGAGSKGAGPGQTQLF